MAPLLYRQPFKGIYILGCFVFMVFIQLPWWLIYYSWRPNRPRRTWTLYRTINVKTLRNVGQSLPFKAGVFTKRDLSLEVPQKELEPLRSRFVWIPELEKKDITGMVEEYAARAGVKSVAIPAYWILKEGAKWSSTYDKARKDEKVLLYLHGGAFMVRSCSSSRVVFALTPVAAGDCTPIPPDGIYSQGNPEIFHLSFPSVVG